MRNAIARNISSLTCLLLLNACASVTIDEYQAADATLQGQETVVVLGRRHSPDYETEPDLISCVSKMISGGNIQVIGEQEFVDQLYPWFEPRMAPMRVNRLSLYKAKPQVDEKIQSMNIRYMVWVDGNTRTTSKSGSIGCAVGVGGGGCFGFGSWHEKSDYEASIWDYKNHKLMGKISADAEGTSYMPAVVVPVPLLARVQSNACKGLGKQLRQIFSGRE